LGVKEAELEAELSLKFKLLHIRFGDSSIGGKGGRA
jgi:hypothetical protein